MNTKVIAIAAIAVVLVVAVAGVAIVMNGGDDDGNFVGVIYDGNGGKTSTGSTTWNLTSTTVERGNIFSNNGYLFVDWNTKADGSGTTYNPGDNISYPEHGNVRLYAQWETDNTKRITSYSPSYSIASGDGALRDGVALWIGDTKLSAFTAYFATLSDNTVIMVSYIDGCTEWAFDETNGYFTFNYNGHAYTLKITVTNSQNTMGFISSTGIPSYGFQPQDDVEISVSLKPVRE